MGYLEEKELHNYLDKHLEEIFSHKEVKNHKKEILEEVNALLNRLPYIENKKEAAVLLIASYQNYNDLIKRNPKLKTIFNSSYHEVYIHARYYASLYHIKENTSLNHLEEYQEKYETLFQENISKDHFQHLTKLAFLQEEVEHLGIAHKKLKTLDTKDAHLMKNLELEKALIY